MICTPGFRAAFGNSEALGQLIEALEYNLAGDVAFVLRKHHLAEILFEILADNEHELAEASFDSVVDAIVHDRLTVRAKTI